MASTTIEWTEATWNPVTGCTRASAGCDLCYAVTMTRRLEAMGVEKYRGLVNGKKKHFNGIVRLHPETLNVPLRKRKATLWFVNSMSDLFHHEVPFDYVAAVFGIMAATPEHQYQVLTKRPERMNAFFNWLTEHEDPVSVCIASARRNVKDDRVMVGSELIAWPLRNVWLGTSVEDEQVIARLKDLQNTPAHVRFLSCEPLIGPLDLRGRLGGIHWVIVGGESGSGARPLHADWATEIRKACDAAGTAYFFKQTGSVLAKEMKLTSGKGSDASEWPDALEYIRIREYPAAV